MTSRSASKGRWTSRLNARERRKWRGSPTELRDKEIETVYAVPCQPARQTAETLAKGLGMKAKRLDRNAEPRSWAVAGDAR